MDTHFGGVGDTPVEDPRTQETDNVSDLRMRILCDKFLPKLPILSNL